MNIKRFILSASTLFFFATIPAFGEVPCQKILAKNLVSARVTRFARAVVSPGLFEPHVESKENTRGYGFFVEKPKHQDNWAAKIWRYYPRKISDWMIKDDNYVFVPFNPFPGRQIAWVCNFLSGDWAIKRISKFLVGAPYTLSKYVTIPLMVWSVGGMAYDNFTPKASDPIEISQHLSGDYQFAPTDHPTIRNPRLEISSDDLRAQIYRKNVGDSKDMQKVYSSYYQTVQGQKKTEPRELFAQVDKLVNETGKPELKSKAIDATHMLFFRLRLLDELYYFPTVFNAQKKEAIDSRQLEVSEFMAKIQFNDSFLQTAKDAYLDGRLTDDEFVRFSQQYIYNLYILEMADLLDQKIVKESFGVISPLNFVDMTTSLKTEMFAAMKSPTTTRGKT